MDVNSNSSTAESSGPVADSSPQVGGPRVNNACEACRAAKVKCTASSSQLGICRRYVFEDVYNFPSLFARSVVDFVSFFFFF